MMVMMHNAVSACSARSELRRRACSARVPQAQSWLVLGRSLAPPAPT